MKNLLEINDLEVTYKAKSFGKKSFTALNSVSLDIKPGETLGLVGESGSGKTTLGRAVLGLAPITGGSIRFNEQEIAHLSRKERRAQSSEIQVVFQDPYNSLNPAMNIGEILAEPLTAAGVSKLDANKRIGDLLDSVGLPTDAAKRLPREFSGGQRQRVAIARALALDPKLIVCDEPVSALDLTTQERVLALLIDIQERTGVAYLFVSHDLGVVRHISHRVAVMFHGNLVEVGDGDQVTSKPHHPYTQKLLMASPLADPLRQRQRREERKRFLESYPGTESILAAG